MTIRRLKSKHKGFKCFECGQPSKYRGMFFDKTSCEQHLPELRGHDTDLEREAAYSTDAEWILRL